jgi:uncharacterized protein
MNIKTMDFRKYFNNPYNYKPYNSFGALLRKEFNGKRIYKPVVNCGGFTCPNRDGSKGFGGCIYCNNDSFRPITATNDRSIKNQIKQAIVHFKERYKADKFIAYFQNYSTTYAPIDYLRKVYYEALSVKDVIGISIGTRPDCINESILDLIQEIANKYYLWLELGLQTIHNKSLKFINRCDTYENFIKTYTMIRKRNNTNINICVHLIHGLPTETPKEMIDSVKHMAELGVNGIKFHQLHVVKDTSMAKLYRNGGINLPSLDEYLDLVGKSLEILPKKIIIHRLFGLSNPRILVAPKWSIKKEKLTDIVDDYLYKNGIYQGKHIK